MAPSYRQVFIRGALCRVKYFDALCRVKYFDAGAPITTTLLRAAVEWEASSRNADPIINANVESEARNHAENCLLRNRRVYFWVPCKFKSVHLDSILSGSRFRMIEEWVHNHIAKFVPRNLNDYIHGDGGYSNALAWSVQQDNSTMAQHVSNLGWRAIRDAIRKENENTSMTAWPVRV